MIVTSIDSSVTDNL